MDGGRGRVGGGRRGVGSGMVNYENELIKGIGDHIKLIKAQLFPIFTQKDKYKVIYILWVGVV